VKPELNQSVNYGALNIFFAYFFVYLFGRLYCCQESGEGDGGAAAAARRHLRHFSRQPERSRDQ